MNGLDMDAGCPPYDGSVDSPWPDAFFLCDNLDSCGVMVIPDGVDHYASVSTQVSEFRQDYMLDVEALHLALSRVHRKQWLREFVFLIDGLRSLPVELRVDVMRNLPLAAFSALAASNSLRDLGCEALRSSLSHHLQSWDLPSRKVVSLMNCEDACIGGEVALAVVHPGFWTPRTLEFYVPSSAEISTQSLFQCFTPYSVASTSSVDRSRRRTRRIPIQPGDTPDVVSEKGRVELVCGVPDGIRASIVMRHRSRPRLQFTIHVSVSDQASIPIFLQPSTHLMNIVTAEGVISPYYWSLFDYRGILNIQLDPPLDPVNPDHLRVIFRDQARGYRFTSDQTFQVARREVGFSADPRMFRAESLSQRRYTGDLVCASFDSAWPLSFHSMDNVRWTTGYRRVCGTTIADYGARVGLGLDSHFISYANTLTDFTSTSVDKQ